MDRHRVNIYLDHCGPTWSISLFDSLHNQEEEQVTEVATRTEALQIARRIRKSYRERGSLADIIGPDGKRAL